MAQTEKYVISARFITTVVHLMSIILVFELKKRNIDVGLNDSAASDARDDALQSVNGAIAFALICIVTDFFGMFSGITLFSLYTNVLQVVFHFIGGIVVSRFITEGWNYMTLWPIVIATSFPTAFVEFSILLSNVVYKLSPM